MNDKLWMLDIWWWAEGFTGLFAIILGLHTVALFVSGLEAATQFGQYHLSAGTWMAFSALWLLALFVLVRVVSALWRWKPYSKP